MFFKDLFCKDEFAQIVALNYQIDELKRDLSVAERTTDGVVKDFQARIDELLADRQIQLSKFDAVMLYRDHLQKQIDALQIDAELEKYWNDKRSKSNLTWPTRPVFGGVQNVAVNPRIYYQSTDMLPFVVGETLDEKAKNCLLHVMQHVVYTPDSTDFKLPEVWLFPFETLTLRKGDCEDGAILLANLMLRQGIPYWRIRINAGDVKDPAVKNSKVGHAWVTYLRESDNEWVVLDWCYWGTECTSLQKKWHDATNYFNIWFSFNSRYVFKDEVLDR